ncbi:MFS transporter [Mucisphaera calidilacus]|uniref:MFS transporter n=1 Tax=Mucisphaera calidilacus TaxID=2527982 RepID=UPI001F47D763|nr:MFS transporter [Mucisphaera calidilacus]
MSPLQRHYLFGFAIFGIVQPYLPLILSDIGLNDAQIGMMMAMFGVSIFVSPPVLGAMADLHVQPRTILAGIFLGIGLSFVLLLGASAFLLAALATGLLAICVTPAMTVSDALHFRIQHERASGVAEVPFHHIRVMGAYGFVMPSLIVPVLMMGEGATLSRTLYFGIVLAVVTLVNLQAVPRVRHERQEGGLAKFPTWTALQKLLSPGARWYCLAMLLFSLSMSGYFTFYPLHLQQLGVEARWVGMIASFGVLPEIVFTHYYGWIERRIGLKAIVVIGALAMCARLLLLYSVPEVWAAILSQVFHGPAIMLIVVVAPVYLNRLAGVSDRTSMMGVFAPMVYGIGRTFGPWIAGSISGGDYARVFLLGVCLTLCSALLLLVTFREPVNRPVGEPVPEALR